ncbi:hypothetical protein [Streptomyces sp. 16-176A]|uniref:hypothetical protein n=1 Tax=Streptomyces sp. 16-176A TaxID=2530458 RepID=UPI00345D9DA6
MAKLSLSRSTPISSSRPWCSPVRAAPRTPSSRPSAPCVARGHRTRARTGTAARDEALREVDGKPRQVDG